GRSTFRSYGDGSPSWPFPDSGATLPGIPAPAGYGATRGGLVSERRLRCPGPADPPLERGQRRRTTRTRLRGRAGTRGLRAAPAGETHHPPHQPIACNVAPAEPRSRPASRPRGSALAGDGTSVRAGLDLYGALWSGSRLARCPTGPV